VWLALRINLFSKPYLKGKKVPNKSVALRVHFQKSYPMSPISSFIPVIGLLAGVILVLALTVFYVVVSEKGRN
jgi:hypothetical protein